MSFYASADSKPPRNEALYLYQSARVEVMSEHCQSIFPPYFKSVYAFIGTLLCLLLPFYSLFSCYSCSFTFLFFYLLFFTLLFIALRRARRLEAVHVWHGAVPPGTRPSAAAVAAVH